MQRQQRQQLAAAASGPFRLGAPEGQLRRCPPRLPRPLDQPWLGPRARSGSLAAEALQVHHAKAAAAVAAASQRGWVSPAPPLRL